ncbi:MAG: carboxypeptidase regulatory-like domain-containing protein [Planctomycetota bacterium]
MASQKNRLALFLVLFSCLLAVAAWMFLQGGTPAPQGDSPEAVNNSTGSSKESAIADSLPSTAPARETIPNVRTSTAQEIPLPPEYERALSGIFGRVVEPEGAPVPGVEVELIGGLIEFIALDIDKLLFEPDSYSVDITQQKQTTNKDGRFRFERVDPRGYYVLGFNLGKARPTFRLVDHTPMPGESVDMGEVKLDPWLAIKGKVVDEANKAMANVRVRATNLPSAIFQSGVANLQKGTGLLVKMGNGKNTPKFMFRMPKWTDQVFDKLPFPYTTTAADGSFTIEGAPAGALTLMMDGAAVPGAYKPIPASKGSEKDVGELVISRGMEIEGAVVDENDKPVGESEVMLGIPSPLASEYVAFLRKPIKTAANGTFIMKGVPGPKAYILARGPGQLDWTINDPYEITGDEIKIKIPAPLSVLVKVTDAAGKPLTAKIAVQRAVEGISLFPQIEAPFVAKPDVVSQGTYRIRGLQLGEFWVYARADGYAITKEKVKIELGDEPTVTIQCELEFAIEATVFGKDKETGKPAPLELATVAGGPDKGMEKLGFMGLGHAKTNKDGVALVRALGDGQYNIVATHPGYAMGLSKVQIPATKQTTIQLLVGGSVEGTVTRGGLPPEKPMMVAIAPRAEEMVQLPRTSITTFEGKFKFTHLFPGEYTVVALPRMFDGDLTKLNPMQFMAMQSENADQECEVIDEETTTVILDLNEGGRKQNPDDGFITGSAFVNGMAAEGDYISASGPEWIRAKPVDASGAFDLGRAKPGEYRVMIMRKNGSFQGPFGGSLAAKSVTVKATEPSFVEFNVRTGKLSGTVFDESKKALPNARVSITPTENPGPWGGGGPNARTDEFGKFTVDEIASGSYRVSASMGDALSSPAMIQIAEGGTQKVDIYLKPAIVVEGTFDANIPKEARWGSMQFQQKTAEGESAGREGRAEVNISEKTFRARRLLPGKYTVSLRVFGGDSSANYKSVEVDVPPGGVKGLSLRFEDAPPPEPKK